MSRTGVKPESELGAGSEPELLAPGIANPRGSARFFVER